MVYPVAIWILCLFALADSLAPPEEKQSNDKHRQKRDVEQTSRCPPSDNVTPRNCRHAKQLGHIASGVYEIDPRDGLGSFRVYCDMETDGGGWTVFQRRKDGSENFNRNWNDYVQGFGKLYGEFWLGLDKIHRLATSVSLRVDLMAVDSVTAFARYEYFTIGDSKSSYTLYLEKYSGTAGDSLAYHRGRKFTTTDRDNDSNSANCASAHQGPWWYGSCSYSNLNSLYRFGGTGWTTIVWNSFKGTASLQRTEMKLK